jgi:hypothetical protein
MFSAELRDRRQFRGARASRQTHPGLCFFNAAARQATDLKKNRWKTTRLEAWRKTRRPDLPSLGLWRGNTVALPKRCSSGR